MKSSILIVEDNPDMLIMVQEGLESDGYNVIATSNAKEFIKNLKISNVDAILLDLILSDENGLNLITQIREHTNAPVIVVSGKSDIVDKIVGLEMGADDYISKPFQMKELCTRIKAQIRRYRTLSSAESNQSRTGDKIHFGKWMIDFSRLQIFDESGNSGDLTIKEFRLLEAFVLSPHRPLSREQLLDKSRMNDFNVTERAIDTQVMRIRKKIGDDPADPKIIQSVRGFGYMFVPPADRQE